MINTRALEQFDSILANITARMLEEPSNNRLQEQFCQVYAMKLNYINKNR